MCAADAHLVMNSSCKLSSAQLIFFNVLLLFIYLFMAIKKNSKQAKVMQ